jgi:gamma-glutamylputrescine oxidase
MNSEYSQASASINEYGAKDAGLGFGRDRGYDEVHLMPRQTPSQNVFWYRQNKKQKRSITPLDKDRTADVVVVGGGMAGITCAEMLATLGADVVLVERDFLGAGASGKTSGFITPDSELELSDLVRNRGPKKAKQLWDFVTGGVDHIAKNIEKHGFDCDYQVQDSLFIANDAKGFSVVEHEHNGRIALGYKSKLYDAKSIGKVIGSEGYAGGVRYPDTFGMNGYLYCQAMKDVLAKKKVKIFEQSRASAITAEGIECNGKRIKAPKVVVCTDRFLPENGILKRDIYHAQTFLSISKPLKDAQVSKIFPKDQLMVWDTDLIYQYFRITGDNRLLLGAASMLYTYDRRERMKTSRIEKKMKAYFAKKFPQIPLEIESIWPGMLGVSKDFVPIAAQHEDKKHLYFLGGAAGLPWAAALGTYLAEKIMKGRKDLDAEFTHRRKFPVSHIAQRVLGTPNAFALSHGLVKYFR